MPYLLCPSEPNDRERPDGPTFTHYPLNYGANAGLWLLYAPIRDRGTGVFLMNRPTKLGEITDGTSNTLGMAEVKAFTPYLRDSGSPTSLVEPTPLLPSDVATYGGEFKVDSGHTEWVDARVHQTGFTTTFAPNTRVPYENAGKVYDVDFNSMREGRSNILPTYAVVTSRSHHVGGVNVLLMDGSVPILTALSYGKPKIAAYFVELGVPVSHDFRQGLAATTIAASLADLVNPTMLDQLPLVQAILEKAALEGDLGTLDKILRDYPFYPVEFSPSELESQRYYSIGNWSTAPGMSEIAMAAVNQPAALERLQFEGFEINHRHVTAIMKSGNKRSLAIAMRDMATREDCARNSRQILQETQEHPDMISHFNAYDILNELPASF